MEITEQICRIEEASEPNTRSPHLACFSGYRVITTEGRILMLISTDQDCCEEWGYFWSEDDPGGFVGADLLSVEIVDDAYKSYRLPHWKKSDGSEFRWDDGAVFVNFETDRGTLQFVIYNEQNGFYGHRVKITSTREGRPLELDTEI